jgi:hypothetical protein
VCAVEKSIQLAGGKEREYPWFKATAIARFYKGIMITLISTGRCKKGDKRGYPLVYSVICPECSYARK